jgi:hypothetical protein
MLRQDAHLLQQQIANLYLQFPELKDDDEVLRVDTLEGATSIKELLSAIVDAKGEAEESLEGATTRLENIKARKARFKRRVEFLRAMMMKIMQCANIRKIQLAEATLSIKAGQPRLIGDPDPNTVPDEFCKIVREPDRQKIRDALIGGATVDGFVLSNGEETLAVYDK